VVEADKVRKNSDDVECKKPFNGQNLWEWLETEAANETCHLAIQT
jgi:hypothetical protein